MYASVIVCFLVAAVSAGPSPLLMLGKPMPPKIKLNEPAPEKCCSDPYYTFKSSSVDVSLSDGKLLTELITAQGAYDSIEKKIGLEVVEDFSNGTDYTSKIIIDYKKGDGYFVYREKGEVICHKFSTESPFPYNCLPDESVYIGSATIGDRALKTEQWYFNDKSIAGENAHIVYSIDPSECIDLGRFSRVFDPETGVELKTTSNSLFDFNLGICNPDKWFKPPSECEATTVKMDKAIPKQLIGLRGPGGKPLFI